VNRDELPALKQWHPNIVAVRELVHLRCRRADD
jgi:hypothetical protein